MKKDGLIYTVIFSFIITFFFVFMLALAHELTKDRVAAYREISEKKALLSALNISFKDNTQVKELYKNKVKPGKKGDIHFYTYEQDGEMFYAREFQGNGLWGTISGVLAVNKNATKIIGLELLSHNETPGLGGRIEEAWFLNQFKNESIINNRIAITKKGGGKGDSDSENGIIDAITGATQTTNFLEKIVNHEISQIKKVIGDNDGK